LASGPLKSSSGVWGALKANAAPKTHAFTAPETRLDGNDLGSFCGNQNVVIEANWDFTFSRVGREPFSSLPAVAHAEHGWSPPTVLYNQIIDLF